MPLPEHIKTIKMTNFMLRILPQEENDVGKETPERTEHSKNKWFCWKHWSVLQIPVGVLKLSQSLRNIRIRNDHTNKCVVTNCDTSHETK